MFNRFLQFFVRKEVQSILAMAVVALCILLGVPQEKQQAALVLIGCGAAIGSAWLLGSSFVKGKELEGTVPEGRESTHKIVIHVGGGAQEVPAEQMELKSGAALSEYENPAIKEILSMLKNEPVPTRPAQATCGFVPPTPGYAPCTRENGHDGPCAHALADDAPPPQNGPPVEPFAVKGGAGSVSTGIIGAILCICALFFGTGCVTTSPAFKEGANAGGQILALRASRYVNADKNIDTPGRMARLAQAEQLKRVTADKKTINVIDTKAAWKSVREWYIAYVTADPTLEFDGRELRLDTAVVMDALINEEKQRPWWITGIPPPATQPQQ